MNCPPLTHTNTHVPAARRYRVDLVLSGHVHAYYRSCSAAGNKCVEEEDQLGGVAGRSSASEGIRHIVLGTAGHVLSSVEDDQKVRAILKMVTWVKWNAADVNTAGAGVSASRGCGVTRLPDTTLSRPNLPHPCGPPRARCLPLHPQDWCEEVLNEFGFGRFDVDGDTMSFSFIRTEVGARAVGAGARRL